MAPERRQHTFFGQPKITGVGLGCLFRSLAIRASLEVLDLSQCVTLDSADVQAMLPSPPRNWKDAAARRVARTQRKERERAKRWRKPRRPPSSPMMEKDRWGLTDAFERDEEEDGMHLVGKEMVALPRVRAGRALSDAGEHMMARTRLISDEFADVLAVPAYAASASGESGEGGEGDGGIRWDHNRGGDLLRLAGGSARQTISIPTNRSLVKAGGQRRRSTSASPSFRVAPARSRAISFDHADMPSMRSSGIRGFVLPDASSSISPSNGKQLVAHHAEVGHDVLVVGTVPDDPIDALLLKAQVAVSSYDRLGRFLPPGASMGKAGIEGLSV